MERADAWRLTDQLHAEHGKGDPFAAAVRATRMAMIITDPRQRDNPIVFSNDAFLTLTGYDRDDVVGRNCRFLQGAATDPAAVARIRAAIAAEVDVNIDVLNYRKDGSTFWNALYLSPVHNEAGELHYFFASQLDVTERHMALRDRDQSNAQLKAVLDAKTVLLHEIDHRVKNNLQLIAAMIGLQRRDASEPATRAALALLLERVEALGTVHRRLYQSTDVSRFELSTFVGEFVPGLLDATGRADIALRLELSPVAVPGEKASPIALMLNELVTNALKHAFPVGRAGTLGITTGQLDGRCHLVVEDDGVGVPSLPAGQRNFAMQLVENLSRQLIATTVYEPVEPMGTRVRISFPLA